MMNKQKNSISSDKNYLQIFTFNYINKSTRSFYNKHWCTIVLHGLPWMTYLNKHANFVNVKSIVLKINKIIKLSNSKTHLNFFHSTISYKTIKNFTSQTKYLQNKFFLTCWLVGYVVFINQKSKYDTKSKIHKMSNELVQLLRCWVHLSLSKLQIN